MQALPQGTWFARAWRKAGYPVVILLVIVASMVLFRLQVMPLPDASSLKNAACTAGGYPPPSGCSATQPYSGGP